MKFSQTDIIAAYPYLTIAVGTLLLLVLDFLKRRPWRLSWGLLVCLLTWAFSYSGGSNGGHGLAGLLYLDYFAVVFNTMILGGAALTLLLNDESLEGQEVKAGIDVDALILLASCGAMVMVGARHLLILFLGFELLSVSVYVLAGLARGQKASTEGALKYFILGAFSSAFLLYGIALIYGATGSLSLPEIAQVAATSNNNMLLAGLALLIFGFGFKVSLFPFHFWTPDAYHGAPTSLAGFMAVVVKAAAFGAFLRVMSVCFSAGELVQMWHGVLWTLSLLTMCVGNLLALRQSSIKRMLAYSSIAHAGYIILGFLALGANGGAEATMYYLFVYSLMTVVAFGVVLICTSGTSAQYDKDDLSSLQGLGWSKPFLGFAMSVAMLSLGGIPPLAGFFGKLLLFKAAIGAGYLGLVIVAVLNSVISLYYYLSVIVVMYFQGERNVSWSLPTGTPWTGRVAIALATFGILIIGILSQPFVEIAVLAVKSLRLG